MQFRIDASLVQLREDIAGRDNDNRPQFLLAQDKCFLPPPPARNARATTLERHESVPRKLQASDGRTLDRRLTLCQLTPVFWLWTLRGPPT